MVAEDSIYPSNTELEIPNLLLALQPRNGLLLPFAGWGNLFNLFYPTFSKNATALEANPISYSCQ